MENDPKILTNELDETVILINKSHACIVFNENKEYFIISSSIMNYNKESPHIKALALLEFSQTKEFSDFFEKFWLNLVIPEKGD